jgi:hypothetical protein
VCVPILETFKDVNLAEKVFGLDIGFLEGKNTQKKPDIVRKSKRKNKTVVYAGAKSTMWNVTGITFFHKKLRKGLESIGLEINPDDPFVGNRMRHIKKKLNDDFLSDYEKV